MQPMRILPLLPWQHLLLELGLGDCMDSIVQGFPLFRKTCNYKKHWSAASNSSYSKAFYKRKGASDVFLPCCVSWLTLISIVIKNNMGEGENIFIYNYKKGLTHAANLDLNTLKTKASFFVMTNCDRCVNGV